MLPVELQLATFDPDETGELTAAFSGTAGRDRLRALLDVQHYRFVHWRTGAAEINYRRFFDVNDLVALRVDDERVFDETHALIVRLVHEGVIDGLRVDHVDGLLDPRRYLERLRAAVPPATPIFVEKILSGQETLPRTWPVDGTTGYEFLNDLDDVFLEPTGLALIEDNYRRTRRLGSTTFRDVALAAKAAFVAGAMRPDLVRLTVLLAPLARAAAKHWTDDELAAGLVSFIVALPVYRTYVGDTPTPRSNRPIATRCGRARCRTPARASRGASRRVRRPGRDRRRRRSRSAATLCFVERLQQLTGPATAKGVEDTALYIYVPLVSRNEVGGGPDRPLDDAVERFHAREAHRGDALAARLDVHEHARHQAQRRRARAPRRAHRDAAGMGAFGSSLAPSQRQTSARRERTNRARHEHRVSALSNTRGALAAAAPRPSRRRSTRSDLARRRASGLTEYMLKAAREAKTRTSWIEPNANYENALDDFVDAVLEPREDAPFLSDVARLVANIAAIGARTSLSRIALHLTSPGTPDIYQGDECGISRSSIRTIAGRWTMTRARGVR